MAWVGWDIKDHLVPAPLLWAGAPPTRPGCSECWALPHGVNELSPAGCQSPQVRGELGTQASVQLTFPLSVSLIYVQNLVVVRNVFDTTKEIIDF